MSALGSITIDWTEGRAEVITRHRPGPSAQGRNTQFLGGEGLIGTEEGGLVTHQAVFANSTGSYICYAGVERVDAEI